MKYIVVANTFWEAQNLGFHYKHINLEDVPFEVEPKLHKAGPFDSNLIPLVLNRLFNDAHGMYNFSKATLEATGVKPVECVRWNNEIIPGQIVTVSRFDQYTMFGYIPKN